VDRERFYVCMHGEGRSDYETYLDTSRLLSCQKGFHELVNADELQFQIVHQSAELWMKLVAYTLLDIDEHMARRATNRVRTLLGRVHTVLRLLTAHFEVLATMSPKEYQEIRAKLGNGSGQESPGFRTLCRMGGPLWETYVRSYLEPGGLTVARVYDGGYDHGDAYVVAECLVEFDQLFHDYRYHHFRIIQRMIGTDAHSLKGRSVELLLNGLRKQLFPELWAIRGRMTDAWGASYGRVRESIASRASGDGAHR
jgi:tryptophan 2,3-dioxygenase